tara:strand:+ start:434 stop:670 length:237 start_codon:yes stop_codon:yes gene_type:complete
LETLDSCENKLGSKYGRNIPENRNKRALEEGMILRKLNREIFMDQSLIAWTHGYLNESERNHLIGKKYLVKSESFYLR